VNVHAQSGTLGQEGVLRIAYQIRKDELDGGYIAECTELPGCISQGDTEQEAVKNLADAVADYISVLIEDHLEKQQAVQTSSEHKDTLVVKPLVALGFCSG